MQYMTRPTKEQVRAYMHQREADHRPPPTPDEIRRQLGWSSLDHAGNTASGTYYLFFPAEIGQLTALLVVEWLFRAGGFNGVR